MNSAASHPRTTQSTNAMQMAPESTDTQFDEGSVCSGALGDAPDEAFAHLGADDCLSVAEHLGLRLADVLRAIQQAFAPLVAQSLDAPTDQAAAIGERAMDTFHEMAAIAAGSLDGPAINDDIRDRLSDVLLAVVDAMPLLEAAEGTRVIDDADDDDGAGNGPDGLRRNPVVGTFEEFAHHAAGEEATPRPSIYGDPETVIDAGRLMITAAVQLRSTALVGTGAVVSDAIDLAVDLDIAEGDLVLPVQRDVMVTLGDGRELWLFVGSLAPDWNVGVPGDIATVGGIDAAEADALIEAALKAAGATNVSGTSACPPTSAGYHCCHHWNNLVVRLPDGVFVQLLLDLGTGQPRQSYPAIEGSGQTVSYASIDDRP